MIQFSTLNPLEAISERDIDLLLLEELSVSKSFRIWFVKTFLNDEIEEHIGVWHSVHQKDLGESDLIFIYKNSNQKVGVLIENKVDALAQPEQSFRYSQRASIGKEEGYWDKTYTCIFAPEEYITKNKEAQLYDIKIPYEEIEEYFKQRGDERSKYKAKLLRLAIEQSRRGYNPEPDRRVTDFFTKYKELLEQTYPELYMHPIDSKPSEADWCHIFSEKFRDNIRIVHKLSRGYVDLQISDIEKEKLEEYLNSIENENLLLVETGKSFSIRVGVPILDRFSEFDDQLIQIKKGLEGVETLKKVALGL